MSRTNKGISSGHLLSPVYVKLKLSRLRMAKWKAAYWADISPTIYILRSELQLNAALYLISYSLFQRPIPPLLTWNPSLRSASDQRPAKRLPIITVLPPRRLPRLSSITSSSPSSPRMACLTTPMTSKANASMAKMTKSLSRRTRTRKQLPSQLKRNYVGSHDSLLNRRY